MRNRWIRGYSAGLSTGAFDGVAVVGASGVVPVILAVNGRWHSDQSRTASTWTRWNCRWGGWWSSRKKRRGLNVSLCHVGLAY